MPSKLSNAADQCSRTYFFKLMPALWRRAMSALCARQMRARLRAASVVGAGFESVCCSDTPVVLGSCPHRLTCAAPSKRSQLVCACQLPPRACSEARQLLARPCLMATAAVNADMLLKTMWPKAKPHQIEQPVFKAFPDCHLHGTVSCDFWLHPFHRLGRVRQQSFMSC